MKKNIKEKKISTKKKGFFFILSETLNEFPFYLVKIKFFF